MKETILKSSLGFEYNVLLKSILEDYYEDLKAFFAKCIRNEEYEYKIFMSRRCFVLYQLFQSIFMTEGADINIGCAGQIIITDKGIVHYREGLKRAQKILLIDDILIYGRTIGKVYDKLHRWAPQAQIDVSVYIKNSGKQCFHDGNLINNLYVRFTERTCEWREFSDKLIYCIYSANMPYTSFVNSYYNFITSDDKKNLLQKFEAWNKYETTNLYQEKYGLSAVTYFPGDMEEKYPLFHSVSRKCCLRVYYNSNINKILLIPYVFLKDIDVSHLNEVHTEYADLLPEFKDDLLASGDTDAWDLATYKVRLLTCVFSYIYGILLFDESNVDIREWMDDMDTVQKSFDDQTVQKLFDLPLDRIRAIASRDLSHVMSAEAALQEWYTEEEKPVFSTNLNLQEKMYAYFRMEGTKDERLAKQGKDRMAGSTVGAILEFFHDQGTEEEIYAYLISAWDTGYASCDWSVTEENRYLTEFNVSGEQSFRQIVEEFLLYFYDIAQIYNEVWKNTLSNKKTGNFNKKFHEKVKEYCNFFNVPKEFEDFIIKERDDLSKYMVRDILNDATETISEEHADMWFDFYDKNF